MKRSTKLLLFLIVLLIIIAGIFGASLRDARLNELRETHQFSKDQIESRTPVKSPSVLVIEGTLSYHYIDWENSRATESRSTHDFELVMQGFTNYFLKETWGAKRGQSSFFGGQKPGGYKVKIRTTNFTGEWQYGWSGTRGGGGGGGADAYTDDLLPGRWLWNHNGFVGAEGNYENHLLLTYGGYCHYQTYEEYQNCESIDGLLIPKKIIWREFVGQNANGEYLLREEKVFKAESIKFQNSLFNGWFEARIKEYIPEHAISKITNAPATSASTNQ